MGKTIPVGFNLVRDACDEAPIPIARRAGPAPRGVSAPHRLRLARNSAI